jgi:hypothetical protein
MKNDLDPFRRRTLLALLGGSLGLSIALKAAAQSATTVGGMHRIKGDVRVNGQRASVGTRVAAGDSVITGPGALAVFSVGGDAFLMRANSHAQFAGKDLVLDSLRLLTGKLLSVFASGGNRSLTTSTATIGIRGTGGYLEAERARTYFCLCYGTADIASADGSMRSSYSTTHHESPRYIYNDGRKNTIVKARVVNHTDVELIMLEALVGRRPPHDFLESTERY